ncbi:MAG: ATP-binding cassette domain-containing protein [Candidatus Dojkabacteria bacterium]|nr:ATP-binding cassette domain-containing protein [Candidatus Dojkabacteria bacterium]
MLKISNLSVGLKESNKQILYNIDLVFKPGEIHILNGHNGSGKSTLLGTIMGDPLFKILQGTIEIEGVYKDFVLRKIEESNILKKDNRTARIILNEIEPNIRSLLGIYLGFQYPVEVPGLSLLSYLRLIYNSGREAQDKMPFFKFKEYLLQKASLLNYPIDLLERNLNEGFSGGEKKKTEILQMLVLEPQYIMLDEIDSGLDRKSTIDVFMALKTFYSLHPNICFIIITHYDKVVEFLQPTYIHTFEKGKIIETKIYSKE